MSIEAMKLALEALESRCGTNADERLPGGAIPTLRTAIQQAESEPVAWVVMNGVSKYQVCGAKAPADALCSEMQKRHDLSGSLAAFHVQPLYTHPAPGVPDGYALVPVEPTAEMKSAGIKVEVYSEASDSIGALTWAEVAEIYRAMLAAAPCAERW